MSWFTWGRKAEKLPVQEPVPNPNCKHLNTSVFGWNRIAYGYCPDCKREICLSTVFTNWIDELRSIKKEMKDAQTSRHG